MRVDKILHIAYAGLLCVPTIMTAHNYFFSVLVICVFIFRFQTCHIVFTSARGLMNSLVFGMSPTVRGEWRLWYGVFRRAREQNANALNTVHTAPQESNDPNEVDVFVGDELAVSSVWFVRATFFNFL